jgi:hypothetical protein
MEKIYLVKFSSDWADEFDMNGFKVMSEEEFEKYKTGMNNEEYPYEAGFGTNEWFDYEDAEDVMNDLTIVEISVSEAEVLTKLFTDGSFGWIPGHYAWVEDC